MDSLIEYFKVNPRKLFLADGLGAILSAFFLGIVLVHFEASFGVRKDLLIYLALAAVVFAGYSLSCFFMFPNKWRVFLKVIASVNLIYCLVTIWFVLLDCETITIMGCLYFIAEILLIVSLVFIEFKVAKS